MALELQRFSGRVAAINHKYGPFNQPTTVYGRNPYTRTKMPTRYASNSTILNIDTFIMSLKQKGKYWGFLTEKMRLKGMTSKAICKVVRKRLVTDDAGHVQGSFFLPAADANRKKKFGYAFTAGEKLFRLVDSPTNSEDDKLFTTLAEDSFRCVGADEASKTITKKIKIIRGKTSLTPPTVGSPNVTAAPVLGNILPPVPDPQEVDETPQVVTPPTTDPPRPEDPPIVGPCDPPDEPTGETENFEEVTQVTDPPHLREIRLQRILVQDQLNKNQNQRSRLLRSNMYLIRMEEHFQFGLLHIPLNLDLIKEKLSI